MKYSDLKDGMVYGNEGDTPSWMWVGGEYEVFLLKEPDILPMKTFLDRPLPLRYALHRLMPEELT